MLTECMRLELHFQSQHVRFCWTTEEESIEGLVKRVEYSYVKGGVVDSSDSKVGRALDSGTSAAKAIVCYQSPTRGLSTELRS